MKITRVRLKNWKNFRNIDIKMNDRVYIIGPNAVGKSNFLDVFRFM
ncbi:AAA family ATPase, partial [Klebsiella pneumoniae]